MEKTFYERIKDIQVEAMNYLDDNLTRTIRVPESTRFTVTAFDFDGEAYTAYVKKISSNGYIIDFDDNEIDFFDLAGVSVARIADYVKSHKK